MDSVRSWLRAMFARARRVERRELREFRDWLEHTSNLLHLSMLVFVPLLIGAITYASNREDVLPFLLFPPLASGTYALFADPENRYASPRRFVGGTTAGALCGWFSLVFLARYWYHVRPEAFHVYAGAAAFAIALTGIVTWGLDIEEPTAFSTALLVLVSGSELVYVLSVAVSTTLVAGVFLVWHRRIYERRGEYLYRSTKGDDHVLVPMRGDHPDATAILGARLAGAHDAGKVVLLDVVAGEAVARAERDLLDEAARTANPDVVTDGGGRGDLRVGDDRTNNGHTDTDERMDEEANDAESELDADGDTSVDATREDSFPNDEEGPSLRERAEERAGAESAIRLEERAAHIEREIGVPCEVVVAVGNDAPARTVLKAARAENCDLIVTPYETEDGKTSTFVKALFGSDIDTVVHRRERSETDRTAWRRVMVPVRRASAMSHTMIDFAERLVGSAGDVSVCHCIGDSGGNRRAAERMLSDLVETCGCDVETRVSRSGIETFLETCASEYDLVVVGASTDRSTASRLLSPPTFERLDGLECDVAIVHR